jgi:hypothetical protein
VVNSDHTLLDDIWAWRADHGSGVGWTQDTADTGVVVNGDDVTATGLFVEHYLEFDVVWNGERGRSVLFQDELPHDAPDQASWSHDGEDGWAAYRVADGVRAREAWGLGRGARTPARRAPATTLQRCRDPRQRRSGARRPPRKRERGRRGGSSGRSSRGGPGPARRRRVRIGPQPPVTGATRLRVERRTT